MIPNVTRGSNIVGLSAYLAGEGRANEHVHPHLVAGSAPIMAWYSNGDLSHDDALEIGRELDQTKRVFGVDIKDGHVWHCSLSLHTDDGILADEKWEAIAAEFMTNMGFINQEGKADVPWAAFRHGLSGTTGNDHIHIAASLVREDGTKASTWKDWPKAQSVCRDLEPKYGLMVLLRDRSSVGLRPQDHAIAKRRGRTEPERQTLARAIRGHATASASEAEFVRRVRRDGLIIKPRFSSGSMEHATGYSIAMQPPAGMKPLYYAGGKIARDLGLGVLRRTWPEPSTEQRKEAAAEWQAAKFSKRIVNGNGPDSKDFNPDLTRAAADLQKLREQLRDIPYSDVEQWRRTAHMVAGVFASWSNATETEPGPLARTADEIARSAQVSRQSYRAPQSSAPLGLAQATALALAAQRGGAAGTMAVFAQLSHLSRAIHDFNRARHDAVREQGLARSATGDLALVHARLKEAARFDQLVPEQRPMHTLGMPSGPQVKGSVAGPKLEKNGGAKRGAEKDSEHTVSR